MKLSVKGSSSDVTCIMAGPDLLALCNNENTIRVFHLGTKDTYTLDLAAFNPRPKVPYMFVHFETSLIL